MNGISIGIRATLIPEFRSSDAISYVTDTSGREYRQPPLRIFSHQHNSGDSKGTIRQNKAYILKNILYGLLRAYNLNHLFC